MTPTPSLRLAGESLLLVEFEPRLDPRVNALVLDVAARVAAAGLPGVRDVVPAYASIGLHLDPLRADLQAIDAAVRHACAPPASAAVPAGRPPSRLIEVPVCYGSDYGPDLSEVAARTSMSPSEVVARHVGLEYRVYMLGFVPGFAYMASVDPQLRLPRRATPRERVPTGSVAMAGEQTGIYPAATPGGWHLIGRTPWTMFSARAAEPSRLQPGDRIRFVPVSPDEFEAIATRERAQ